MAVNQCQNKIFNKNNSGVNKNNSRLVINTLFINLIVELKMCS